MDLQTQFPISPREQLDGIMIVARAIDKAQAELDATLGDYIYWDCPMDNMLFETLGVTATQFLDAVRKARGEASSAAQDFLAAARESPEDPSSLTDEQIITNVMKPHIDASILRWIKTSLKTEHRSTADMNDRFEATAPSTFEKRFSHEDLTVPGTKPPNVVTFADLLDLQEGRLVRT